MNRNIRFLLASLFTFLLLAACQQKKDVQRNAAPADTLAVMPSESSTRQPPADYSTANKGKIESVREIPVFSRIAEQIVMFAAD